jgi:hypothetical protein
VCVCVCVCVCLFVRVRVCLVCACLRRHWWRQCSLTRARVTASCPQVRDTLVIRSADGGEYAVPLVGSCLPPRPQGPLAFAAGQSINVEFRNVFTVPYEFTFATDNPSFALAARAATVQPKKPAAVRHARGCCACVCVCVCLCLCVCACVSCEFKSCLAPTVGPHSHRARCHQVAVKYTKTAGQPTSGKLVVDCPALPDVPPFVFYLKGAE